MMKRIDKKRVGMKGTIRFLVLPQNSTSEPLNIIKEQEWQLILIGCKKKSAARFFHYSLLLLPS